LQPQVCLRKRTEMTTMMDTNNFNFSAPIQMRWNDLDALGHVNNAIFITYFEVARGGFMMKACPKWDWTKHMFLIANANVDFRKELLLTAQNPQVHVRTSKLGGKSFVLEYAVTSQKGGETVLHATGSTTQIMFDTKARTTIEVPDWVRESLQDFDGIA
jgi:acyl-CoA thioester hydrolase